MSNRIPLNVMSMWRPLGKAFLSALLSGRHMDMIIQRNYVLQLSLPAHQKPHEINGGVQRVAAD